MDLDFSRKVTLIRFLEKLIKFPPVDFPLGAIYHDIRGGYTYVYIGEGRWMSTKV